MSHLQQESFQIILMVPLLPRSAIFPLNLNSIASMRQNHFSQGRTYQEGALLRYSCRRGAYYLVGRTHQEGRTNWGSMVLQKRRFSCLKVCSLIVHQNSSAHVVRSGHLDAAGVKKKLVKGVAKFLSFFLENRRISVILFHFKMLF